MSLWGLVPLSSFNDSIGDEVVSELVSLCTGCICEWLDKTSYTAADARSLVIIKWLHTKYNSGMW